MNKLKDRSSVVKIDSILFRQIEDFIKKEENRLKFGNKKQFIDIVVNEFFKKIKKVNK
ncbi:MAG: hypothetical protein KJ646_05045 [Nanoarchaeota archaeon]|nr:hypothetical protein [Nanoarchaeota archaeon]MBU4116243.1 hypothetical protein [Nanoarchaeota archaeon]